MMSRVICVAIVILTVTQSCPASNTCFLSPLQLPNFASNPTPSVPSQPQGLVAQKTFSFPAGPLPPVSPAKHLTLHHHSNHVLNRPQQFPSNEPVPVNIDASLAQFIEASHNHIKGGGAPSLGSNNRGNNFPSTTTTTTPLPPVAVVGDRPRSIYRRPASRTQSSSQTDFNRLFLTHEQFVPRVELINRQELEAISQFEAALEEAKRHGLYGLRTRSSPTKPTSKTRSQFYSQFPVKTTSYSQQTPASTSELIQRGIEDFKESFGFDPTSKTSIGVRRTDPLPPPPALPPPPGLTQQQQPQQSPQIQVQDSQSQPQINLPSSPDDRGQDDDGFGTSFNSLSPSSPNPVVSSNSVNLFIQWLERQQLIGNMRIAPGVNFTVLLPNDNAVNMLPKSFVYSLEQNATRMREILFYHIIPETFAVDSLQNDDMIPTLLSKKDIRVTKSTPVMMSGVMIVSERKDLELDGGKVRFLEVDRVLFPPAGTLYDVLSRAPGLGIFKRLVDETGLKSQLEQPVSSSLSGLTIFAPSDQALRSLSPEAVSLLTRDRTVARSLVLNHFSQPVVFASSLPIGSSSTVKNIGSGLDLSVTREETDLVKVNGATVLFADITATNGILHVIDHVLI